MVIFVILSRQHMRTTVNLSLLNLAVCDIIFVSVCVPFVAYHYAADKWTMGDVLCKLSQFLLYVTIYVTTFTLVYVSTLRFFLIVHGTKTHHIRTKQNVIMVIAIIWAVMLVGNIPILLLYRVKEITLDGSPETYEYCGMNNKETGQWIFLSFFICAYILPLSIISLMYLSILRFLTQKRKESGRLSVRNTDGACTHSQERTMHATRIVISVVIIFGICWLPLHLHLLLVYFGRQPQSRVYEVYRMLCHVFAYSNSCMNPFIYHYVSRDFRVSFKNIFIGWGCFKQTSDTQVTSNQEHISLNVRDNTTRNHKDSML